MFFLSWLMLTLDSKENLVNNISDLDIPNYKQRR